MSQTVSAPLRTARQLQKLKEIRKVKSAIRWHERARKKRQASAKERWETKHNAMQQQAWYRDNVANIKKEALRHAREDWLLGPLRPNRAIGSEAEKYGVLERDQLRRVDIPVYVQKRRNEIRVKKGLEPEYPLVVEDKKYFHIVQNDRVVVINGREKGKIGVVDHVDEDTHEITIKDLNKHYADASLFASNEEGVTKRELEVALPLSDVRLVIPYRITTYNAANEPKDIYEDVIVDQVVMERHTTGIDPFTRIDYGRDEFPEEHRYDPSTGLAIFNRYIAGSRRRIPWPWEEWEKDEPSSSTSGDAEQEEVVPMWKKPFRYLGSGWKSLTNLTGKLARPLSKAPAESKEDPEKRLREDEEKLQTVDELVAAAQSKEDALVQPLKAPADHEEDTGRNQIEDDSVRTFYTTLVYPPFPNELSEELAPHIREAKWNAAKSIKDKNSSGQTEKEVPETDHVQEKQNVMKTPMQLRWEIEQMRKMQMERAQPKVPTEVLLAALGRHMEQNGVGLNERTRGGKQSVELD